MKQRMSDDIQIRLENVLRKLNKTENWKICIILNVRNPITDSCEASQNTENVIYVGEMSKQDLDDMDTIYTSSAA
jgi:hypothetical protein